MTKFLFSLLMLFIGSTVAEGQQNHFIYLQTEGKQPFYAKLDNKILSSSASGYLIIPKLKDGIYNIAIGFPKNETGEEVYECTIDNKDAGYLVKNFGDKGWGLFNLQTLDVVMSGNISKKNEVAKTQNADEFSSMLSDVVNNPAIKQPEKPKDQEKTKPGKKEVSAEPAKPNELQEKGMAENNVVKKETTAGAPLKRSNITRKEINTDDYGTVITYIDGSDAGSDTIRIFLPAEKVIVKELIAPVNEKEGVTADDVAADKQKSAVQREKQKVKLDGGETDSKKVPELSPTETVVEIKKEEDKKFLPVDMADQDKKNDEIKGVSDNTANMQMINSDCRNDATDDDFLKLRKKMAAAEDDDEMIQIANKVFKSKCFTTMQIKNLSVLFLKDEGKYKFFDLAYQHVSDSGNFNTLESQLSDNYYISRFRVMVKHQ